MVSKQVAVEDSEMVSALQNLVAMFWQQTSQMPSMAPILQARGNKFPASALEQAQECQIGLCDVFPAVSSSLFRKPALDSSNDVLAYDIFQAIIQAIGSSVEKDKDSPCGALACASNAYFVPFLPVLDFTRLYSPEIRKKLESAREGQERNKLEEQLIGKTLRRMFDDCNVGLYETTKKIKYVADFVGRRLELFWSPDTKFRINPFIHAPIGIAHDQSISADFVVLTYGICASVLARQGILVEKIYEAGVGSWRHLAYMACLFPEAQFFGCDPFPDFCQVPDGVYQFEEVTGIQVSSHAKVKPGDFVHELGKTNFAQNGPYQLIYVTFLLPEYFDINSVIEELQDRGMFIAPIADESIKGDDKEGAGWLCVFRKRANQIEKVKLVKCRFQPRQKGIQTSCQ